MMMNIRSIRFLLFALLLLPLAIPAKAQEPTPLPGPADTTLAAVLDRLRARPGGLHGVNRVLRQEYGPESPARLQALTDSLVAIATDYRPGDAMEKLHMAQGARGAILTAGTSSEAGTPYAGSFDALLRIHQGAGRVGGRAAALRGAARVQIRDDERLLAYLDSLATVEAYDADVALSILVDLDGGMEVLQRLYETDAVTHRLALRRLRAIAAEQDWPVRPGECRGGFPVRRMNPDTGELGPVFCAVWPLPDPGDTLRRTPPGSDRA